MNGRGLQYTEDSDNERRILVEQKYDRFLSFAALCQDGPSHTVGSLVQFVVCKLVIRSLDGDPPGVLPYLFLKSVGYRLLNLFLLEFEKGAAWVVAAGLDGVLLPGNLTDGAGRRGRVQRRM